MNLKTILATLLIACLLPIESFAGERKKSSEESVRIINIINFIRKTDYRLSDADNLLFDAVEQHIKLVNRYDFPATFLFQYDALITPRYQELMKTQLSKKCEIGAWWEITQPHVEAAGIEWRGNHSWVSTANIAFTTGYTPQQRERLVDVYMEKFHQIYGFYPKSVGSWYIDSHTLKYMYDKYGIVASCNCKDQVGTDGYTLWGGYWNQGYYPSLGNAYMPAQTHEQQIPVPIFRMLGSDPIYQYDAGIGTNGQGVISLEPVYEHAGKNKEWVSYFLESITNQPSLAFNYAQVGQENSFTWSSMQEGLEMQYPMLKELYDQGKIRMETLASSGKWFKEKFPLTPATAVTALTDVRNQGNKTLWYNSRFYRANLYWERNGFCFRDIHMFDERLESQYLTKPGTGGQFFYFTLPVVDRYFWSTPQEHIGLRVVDTVSGKEIVLGSPVVSESSKSAMQIKCTDRQNNLFIITLSEGDISISCKTKTKGLKWAMELKVPQSRVERLPFKSFDPGKINATFNDFKYTITCKTGDVVQGNNTDYVFRLVPTGNRLVIDCSGSR